VRAGAEGFHEAQSTTGCCVMQLMRHPRASIVHYIETNLIDHLNVITAPCYIVLVAAYLQ
jgi:hypothetical protein